MRKDLRKFIIVSSATTVFVSVCFLMALVANAEFRESVCVFFGITDPETVPQMVPSGTVTSGIVETGESLNNIADTVKGTCIHFPIQSSARNGLFMVCTDEVQMNSGNHYAAYYEEDGECIRLEEHTFDQNYHILGNDIHLEFQWVEHEGNASFTYVETDIPLYKPDFAGRVSSSLMMLCIDPPGDLAYTLYPVLINVQTGELTDICAGLEVESLPEILQAAISQDLTKMVLVDWEKNLYFADLVNKGLYPVDELIGKKVSSCVLTDEKLICLTDENGIHSAYAFDPAIWKSQEVYSGHPKFIKGFDHNFLSSAIYLGTRFALETDADRNVFVIDLTNGTRSLINGLLWPEADSGKVECVPSIDGNKLLIYTRAAAKYESVGVIDFSHKSYTAFSREDMNDVDERTAYWFDSESVIIEACSDDNSGKDYYIYRISSKL